MLHIVKLKMFENVFTSLLPKLKEETKEINRNNTKSITNIIAGLVLQKSLIIIAQLNKSFFHIFVEETVV